MGRGFFGMGKGVVGHNIQQNIYTEEDSTSVRPVGEAMGGGQGSMRTATCESRCIGSKGTDSKSVKICKKECSKGLSGSHYLLKKII